MTKKVTDDLMSLYLDELVMKQSAVRACKAVGISRMTPRRWEENSEAGHPDFQEIEWGGTIKPFHQHVFDAIDISIDDSDGEIRHAGIHGYYTDQIADGNYCYMDCEYAMSLNQKEFEDQLAMTEDTREMCGFPRIWHDRKKRVFDEASGEWQRVRVQRWEPPRIDALSKVLMSYSDRYADKRQIDLRMQGSLGVTVIDPFAKKTLPVAEFVQSVPEIAYQEGVVEEIEYNNAGYVPVDPPPADAIGARPRREGAGQYRQTQG
jgi:hypothetical protein